MILRRTVIFFATANKHKIEEVQYALKDYPLDFKHLDIKGFEIQSESVVTIAKNSALRAAVDHKISVIVEDTGLFIDALHGFPGPYAAYVYDTLGTRGVLTLLGDDNRNATFRSAVAFCDPSGSTACFVGECFGRISTDARGSYGFGYDPIFEPYDGVGKTFAEMRLEEKSTISHRSQAMRKFADWYIARLSRSMQ